MSYQLQNKEIVISGWENGIGTPPHKGLGNIQAGNISTETGEVMCNFNRIQQSQASNTPTATITAVDGSHFDSNQVIQKGQWVTISGSSNTGQLTLGS